MSEGDILTPDDFFFSSKQEESVNADNLDLEGIEKKFIQKAFQKHHNNISKAASELGLSRSALYRRMEKFNISK